MSPPLSSSRRPDCPVVSVLFAVYPMTIPFGGKAAPRNVPHFRALQVFTQTWILNSKLHDEDESMDTKLLEETVILGQA